MAAYLVALLSALVILTVLVILVVLVERADRAKSNFYTTDSREEPTRSYVPYTGTIPNGPWGNLPWSEAVSYQYCE